LKEYINTVIIPTTCKAERRESLLAAIESIAKQEGLVSKILIVINGSVYDADLNQVIQKLPNTELVFSKNANLALAIEYGRSLVQTKYFSFLDDDDKYIENTLLTRVSRLEEDASIDVLVTNGYDVSNGEQALRVKDPAIVNRDPLTALMDYNWLASCGGMFRLATVTNEYFKKPIKYYEWTTIAFRVSGELNVVFVDTPTYCVNDTSVSLSKSAGYIIASESIIRMMLASDKSQKIRKTLNSKLSSVLHTMADFYRHNNNLTSAWYYHIKSLFFIGGYRYLAYTRKLLYTFFKTDRK